MSYLVFPINTTYGNETVIITQLSSWLNFRYFETTFLVSTSYFQASMGDKGVDEIGDE